MELYHHRIGFPSSTKIETGVITPQYTSHAIDEAKKDEHGVIKLPRWFIVKQEEVIEIGIVDGRIKKVLVRMSYAHNPEYDLCIVYIPDEKVVKTVWLVEKDDHHSNLNTTRYCIPK